MVEGTLLPLELHLYMDILIMVGLCFGLRQHADVLTDPRPPVLLLAAAMQREHSSSCYFEALLCEVLSRNRNPTGMRGAFRCGHGSSSTGVPLSPLSFLGCDPCWRPGPCPYSYVGHPEDVTRPIDRQPLTLKASF